MKQRKGRNRRPAGTLREGRESGKILKNMYEKACAGAGWRNFEKYVQKSMCWNKAGKVPKNLCGGQ
jgi:hypothetical protein